MRDLAKLKFHTIRYSICLVCLCLIMVSANSCFFDKEIKQDTEISDYRAMMLKISDSLENPHARIKAYEKLLEQIGENEYIITERKKNNLLIEGLFHISDEYYKLRHFDKAIDYCNQALKLNADNAVAYYNRGVAYQAKHDFQMALSDYTKAIDLDSDYCDAYYNRGLVYENWEDYGKALLDYEQALRLKPSYRTDVYIGLGNSYRGLKETDKAVASYEKALALDSLNIDVYLNKGSILAEIGKYEEALADYSRAIRIDSTNADLFNRRAYTFELMKEYANAIENYKEVIKLDPKGKYGYKNLATEGIERVNGLKRKSRK